VIILSEIQDEIPIKAISETIVSKTSITQKITFSYFDPALIYFNYRKLDLLDQTLFEIEENFQLFLSKDKLRLNNTLITLQIIKTNLVFYKRNKYYPEIVFSIVNENSFLLLNGENVIFLEADQETLEYPIISKWRFPGKIICVESPLHHKISGFNVLFSGQVQEKIGGLEKFIFSFSKR
jgi:hypothetical protein